MVSETQGIKLTGETPDGGGRRLFSVHPASPFLPTLCEALIHGRLVEGFEPASDPSSLAGATLYVPTRRAARALGLVLHETMRTATGTEAILLPAIRTIGDVDEEEEVLAAGAGIGMLTTPVIGETERLMKLAPLTRHWAQALRPEQQAMLGGETIVLPASSSDAIRLAAQLAGFIDQVNTEEADWQAIAGFDTGNSNAWWQLTVNFLAIVMENWPQALAEAGLEDPSQARRKLIDARRKLIETRSGGPVIAAGSTGSIPATARFLRAIARHPMGAVVLPGHDSALDPAIRAMFVKDAEMTEGTALSTHPQYMMTRLVHAMGPGAVPEIGAPERTLATRNDVLKAALLPALETGRWREIRPQFCEDGLAEGLAGVSLVEAANDRQEAAAIALILRHALETPSRTAALVTPDRMLAGRVCAELERFGVSVDDTGGQPLAASAPAELLRLILAACFGGNDPLVLAGLLSHRLLLAGHDRQSARKLAEHIELACIREARSLPSLATLEEACLGATAKAHQPHADWRCTADSETADRMAGFARAVSAACAPLLELAGQERSDLCTTLCTAASVMMALGSDDNGGLPLIEAAGWRELSALIRSCEEAGTGGLTVPPGEIPACFDALLAGRVHVDPERTHPRLQIYGQLEARLQHHDLIVLGGLNESVWPHSARNDPFLNRPMKSALELPLPERRIGQAAHDFVQLACAPEAVFTRSMRSGGAPTVASRWLQRLLAFAGETHEKAMKARGGEWCRLADAMERRQMPQAGRIERAQFTPPVSARPRQLSFSRVETWIRDPYAIHARDILGLRALPRIIATDDAALRGSLYHAILKRFVTRFGDGIPVDGHEQLLAIAREVLAEEGLPAHSWLAWIGAFEEIAEPYLEWEASMRVESRATHVEVKGSMEIGPDRFRLHGRADRIAILEDGTLAIIDYKTGSHPSKDQARGLSPQLTLEAAAARAGGFEGIAAAPVSRLEYVRLRPGTRFAVDDICKNRSETFSAEDLAGTALSRLERLVAKFSDPQTAYVSRFAPVRVAAMDGEYDHLARVREWSLDEDETDQ